MTTTTHSKKKRPNTWSDAGRQTLLEDKTSDVALIEDTHFSSAPLQVESKETNGKKRWFLKGEFGRVNEATANKRYYPKDIIEGQIKKLKEGMEGRRVFGMTDHPADGRTSLNGVSHVITKLEIKDNGSVYGEAEILPTAAGNNLKALAEAGCGIGFSSRGFGSTKPNLKGEDEVQEDYRLVTYDAVADPASKDAWPEAVQEAKKQPVDAALSEEILADAESMRALQDKLAKTEALLASAETRSLSRVDEAAAKVVSAINDSKAVLEANIKNRLLADPEVAGSKTALEAIIRAVQPFLPENAEVASMTVEKDKEIAALQKQVEALEAEKVETNEKLEKLAAMAKIAGYNYFLEKNLNGVKDADLIRQVVGDVSTYNSSSEITAKIETIKVELARREQERTVQEQKESLKVRDLEDKIKGLAEALETSVALNKRQAIETYVAERVKFHPKRETILAFFAKTPPETRTQVDEALEEFRVPMSESDQAEDIRSRVRRLLNSPGQENAPVVEGANGNGAGGGRNSNGAPVLVEEKNKNNWNNTGMSFEDIQKLSGLSH